MNHKRSELKARNGGKYPVQHCIQKYLLGEASFCSEELFVLEYERICDALSTKYFC